MYRFDGSTVLVIKTDVTYTVTHQTTHILPPAGSQNALDESHKKPSAQQAARHIFSHPAGRKTLSTRATQSHPHGKQFVGQACSIDVGEPRTSPEGSHAEWRHFPSVGLRRSAAANRAASRTDPANPPLGLTGRRDRAFKNRDRESR